MSRDLDNHQATKLRVCTLVVFSAGGRKQTKQNHFYDFRADDIEGIRLKGLKGEKFGCTPPPSSSGGGYG